MGAGAVRETTEDTGHGGGDETQFISALRAGEESAFVELIDRYHAGMVRLAHVFVRDAAIAEEVVQEAWLGVLRGLDRFEARSSLKRWISSVLINGSKTRATRERRSIPFSALTDDTGLELFEPSVEPERFRPDDAERCRGGEVNQRVLLHRGRAKVRGALELYLSGT